MSIKRLFTLGLVSLPLLGALILVWPYAQARWWPPKPLTNVIDQGSLQYPADFLLISSLGIEAPIQYINERTEIVYQAALENGVVHYPGTALPGQLGNVYIFGHSSDYVWLPGKYKTIFAQLPGIESGTEILVTNNTGQPFVYKVIETKVVGPKDLSVLDQFKQEKYFLTLQTSYPLGTALQRYIVVAEMVLDGQQQDSQSNNQ